MTPWAEVEAALDGILARRWYTNHGPAVQALERRLAGRHGMRHAVVATNPTIAHLMLMDGLRLDGAVLLSSAAPRHCVQAVHWAGLRAVPCPVEAETGGMVPDALLARLGGGISGVLLSGTGEDGIGALLTARGVAVWRDGVGAGGPQVVRLGACGEAAGIACILCDDDVLAAQLRNIRSSYGAGPPVAVLRTANGRVSEAQAALALLAIGEGHVAPHGGG